jgi:hypothetical protein
VRRRQQASAVWFIGHGYLFMLRHECSWIARRLAGRHVDCMYRPYRLIQSHLEWSSTVFIRHSCPDSYADHREDHYTTPHRCSHTVPDEYGSRCRAPFDTFRYDSTTAPEQYSIVHLPDTKVKPAQMRQADIQRCKR